MRIFVALCCALAVVRGIPVSQDESVVKLMVSNLVNCANSELSLCLKENALKATERLGTVRELNLIDGVTIVNNGPREARSLESLPTDPEERKKAVAEKLWENTSELLSNSAVEFSFAGPHEEESESRALTEESRGKKKKKKQAIKQKLKILVPLAILAKIKAIALTVISLVVIAASIFKIAVIAKIAFLAKLAQVIKDLIAKKKGQEETWVPHEESHGWSGGADSGHGYESGWSRSRNEASNLAYSAYRR